MRVFVTGGTGYVGQAVVKACLHAGCDVSVLTRLNTKRPLTIPGLDFVEGDLFDDVALLQGMTSADAVIHLVGIIREKPSHGITMDRIHRMGTLRVIDAAKTVGVSRFVHMSALGAREQAVSDYHKSKWRAENIVRESGIPFTIFRPSVIFGKGGPGPNFISQLADLVRTAPFVPVIGDGSTKLQPVSIETVAQVFCQSLNMRASLGKTYEVGGPEVISYLEILERIAAKLNKPLRPIYIPMGLMRSVIPVLQHLPKFPLTEDQLTMLREGNVCSIASELYADFNVAPIPFEVIV